MTSGLVPVAVRLPAELVEAVDLLASRHGHGRSDELRSAIWAHLDRVAYHPDNDASPTLAGAGLAHPRPDKEGPDVLCTT